MRDVSQESEQKSTSSTTAMEKMLLLTIIEQKSISGMAHFIHIVLIIVTMGFWSPIWILHMASVDVEKNKIRKQNGMKEKTSLPCLLFTMFIIFVVIAIFKTGAGA